VILDLNSEEASSSPKDDGLDEMKWTKQFCWLCPMKPFFCTFCTADNPQDMRSKRRCFSSFCQPLYFTVRHQTSDIRHQTSDIKHQTSNIFIEFLISSLTVRRQGKSSGVELSIQLRDLLLSIRHQEWGYILHTLTLGESWFLTMSRDYSGEYNAAPTHSPCPFRWEYPSRRWLERFLRLYNATGRLYGTITRPRH
jgi:hypothetical protein